MNRRRFFIGAAAIAASRANASPLADGQSVTINGREYVLSDILAPSTTPLTGAPEPASDFALAIVREAIRRGAPIARQNDAADRWGRVTGAVPWRGADGSETTLQETLLLQGAARVAPQTDDLSFIERCMTAEVVARKSRLGLWANAAYRIRDAARGEWANGFQLYSGAIHNAVDRGGRVFFNFAEDYRTDFTATVAASAFRRWEHPVALEACVGKVAEVRGFVERINGPSIELRHEMQLRLI